jgi:hypothetical protein
MVRSKAVWGGTMAFVMAVSVAGPASAETLGTAPMRPAVRPGVVSTHIVRAAEPRPGDSKVLPVLFGTYAALQVLDVKSTTAAVRNGAVEANPMVGSMSQSTGQFLAYKAATTAVTYAVVKTIEKKSKKAAVVTMVVLNGVTAAVVANNVKNARR